ncbi:HD domain-containing protein [Flexivirga alba]|uniref:HD domain-containing protein n=1 Tax=Flexivirga alba TaxID=702742 RepID=A0ABW2AJL6_9MICO
MPAGPSEAESLARRLLEMSGARWQHVRGVAARTHELTHGHPDRNELAAAAWLHDVGYADEVSTTGFHPLDGARYVASRGFAPDVVGLVAYHSGADVEAGERGLSEELRLIDRPKQALLDILILADMTTSPIGQRVGVDARIVEILGRYDDSHPVHRAVARSQHELRAAAHRAAVSLGLPSADEGLPFTG